jgi:hypothetical protein
MPTTRIPLLSVLLPVWLSGAAAGCSLPAEGLEPGSCSDRIDNDGNYYFDCNDPGCAGSPDCATEDDGSGGDDGGDEGGDSGGDDSGGGSGTNDPTACNTNTYTLTFDDDSELILNAWVWQEGWGGAHLVGMATGDADGCDVATEFFTDFTGYDDWFFQIDLPAVPSAGSIVRIQTAADGSADGHARLENLSTGALETSQDGGRMSVDAVELNGMFVASDVYTRMSGGTAPQGDLTACWCEGTPIGPEPDE